MKLAVSKNIYVPNFVPKTKKNGITKIKFKNNIFSLGYYLRAIKSWKLMVPTLAMLNIM